MQNPTSQGISLRGLGSTAASRTLVLQDNVPMNDPFGGWIHWDEIPAEAVDSVTIATGGGSDLYGSSALGGVIDVVPAHPTTGRFDAERARRRPGHLLARHSAPTSATPHGANSSPPTPTAPPATSPPRPPSPAPSTPPPTSTTSPPAPKPTAFRQRQPRLPHRQHAQRSPRQRHAHPDQRHPPLALHRRRRLVRQPHASGRVRLFGSDEGYRQSFSSINAARTSETLTRLQHVRTQELGASTDASFALSPIAFVAGVDVRDIRATDNETPITSGLPSGIADTSARQRFLGGFGEALATAHTASSATPPPRSPSASTPPPTSTRDPSPNLNSPPTLTPNRSEFIASPRLGIVRQIASTATIHASVFRAFRTPTMNELYRTGQVGQETTQANSQLLSERATGWEIGATYTSPANLIALSGTYFWTEINRPVSAVLISSTATSIIDMRENLGQIL